jgi:hypothetical protein
MIPFETFESTVAVASLIRCHVSLQVPVWQRHVMLASSTSCDTKKSQSKRRTWGGDRCSENIDGNRIEAAVGKVTRVEEEGKGLRGTEGERAEVELKRPCLGRESASATTLEG